MQNLSDAEFEIMKILWQLNEPLTAAEIRNHLDGEKARKVQTIIVFLNRLISKGFLTTEKKAERIYTPLISEQEYLRSETEQFLEKYHSGSFVGLFNTLQGNKLSEKEMTELTHLLEEMRKKP